ncbi:hypothetical protein P170DRAFT_513071 [Aspergillus steynii IBT 23096]|uniref:Uncharacterized protein n=1 Tax=Aspergillus steynii IBT 23096 TaxID=1392250 RepID=A0A2I2FWE7_9EURO|nr:uncharacterized protein P170DRAFT_513071 [Aspergillus steynii IBT 23096]PLB44969.1 hypothetical protein P170DRAFT_513071 [Aspergillus steynii IBT 23096]
MHPYLAVAIYHPRYGNFQHWALHLHTSTEDTIYEVDGEHPSFQKVTSSGNPRDSETFIHAIFVSEVGDPDIPTIRAIVDGARVDNETLEWDCQEYVLEIIEACEQEAVLDDHDLEYMEAKETLKQKRGPMI